MNNIKKLKYTLFVFLLLFTSSCKEYKVVTIIRPDGTCERIVVTKSKKGKGEFKKRAVSINIDDTWKTYEEKIEPDSIIGLASKQFDSVAELNEELKVISKFRVDVKLEKEFRWFYSYLTYSEIYSAMNPFNNIPIDEFLSKEELNELKNGNIEDSLKSRLEDYLSQNMYEYFFESLDSVVNKKGLHEIDVSKLRADMVEFEKMANKDGNFTDNFMKYAENLLNTKQIWELEQSISVIEERIINKLDLIYEGDYTNEVIMPGLLINTNADNIEGNKVTWNFNADRFTFIDYEMVVNSRVVNVWAMIVTGLVAALLIILLIVPKVKRRSVV